MSQRSSFSWSSLANVLTSRTDWQQFSVAVPPYIRTGVFSWHKSCLSAHCGLGFCSNLIWILEMHFSLDLMLKYPFMFVNRALERCSCFQGEKKTLMLVATEISTFPFRVLLLVECRHLWETELLNYQSPYALYKWLNPRVMWPTANFLSFLRSVFLQVECNKDRIQYYCATNGAVGSEWCASSLPGHTAWLLFFFLGGYFSLWLKHLCNFTGSELPSE